jgi:hypothetical protein
MSAARAGTCPGKAHPRFAGRYMRPRNAPGSQPAPTTPITSNSPPASVARACLALARKLLKRSYHLLKNLGDDAIAPVA